ncbi:MAG: EAL domain-containing protein [Cellulosilyticaceae bacterium]
MDGQKVKIMIISNQARSTHELIQIIQEDYMEIQVSICGNARELSLDSVGIDLVILDVVGEAQVSQFMTYMEELTRIKNIPIILTIDTGDFEWCERYLNQGITEYIEKPYQKKKVQFRLARVLEHAWAIKEMKQKKVQFNALLNNTPYMAWFKDSESRYIMVNDDFMEHCGKSLEVIQGQGDHFVWDGHIGSQCRDYDLKVMSKRKRVVFDEVIPGKKGYRQFNIYKAPVIDDTDQVIGTIGIARDVTEIKNKDTKFNIIMENIPFCVYLKDIQGKLVNVNTKFLEFFGVKDEDVIGMEAKHFIDEAYEKQMVVHDAQVLEERKHLVFKERIRTYEGEKIIEIHKSPVFDIANQVIGIVGLFRDITDLIRAEEEIKRLAYYDVLTGLSNRRGLYHYIEEGNGRKHREITVMFIDLDNFKQLNDTCGHYYGDEALVVMAHKLQEVAQGAFVARVGGDEFVVIWEGRLDEKMLSQKADDVLAAMTTEFDKDERMNIISASMGIVTGNSEEATIDSLLAKGDIALYKAKLQGKNQYVFYTKELEQERILALAIEKDLKKAISKNEINLFYQPQYTSEGVLKGFEALFRWQNPKYQKIPVISIIKIIEKCNLIDVIGEYVIREAFTFAKYINHIQAEKLVISVNISAIQIMSRHFVQKIKDLIEEVDVQPEFLGIEITETVLLENLDNNIAKIKELKDLGLVISLDDFGTGYSSLSYLVKLPLTEVKIDRSFVQGMSLGEEYIKLVKLMIDTTHLIGLPVIAEGVETLKELEVLKKMDIDFIQGYLFGRPLPQEEAKRLVLRQ